MCRLPTSLSDFPCKETSLKHHPPLLGLPSLQGSIPWYSYQEEAEVCSPALQSSELAVQPLCCSKDLKLHHFTDPVEHNVPELHIPHQPFLVRTKFTVAPLLLDASIQPVQEFITKEVQEAPNARGLCLSVLSFQQTPVCFKSWQGHSCLSVRQSIANYKDT